MSTTSTSTPAEGIETGSAAAAGAVAAVATTTAATPGRREEATRWTVIIPIKWAEEVTAAGVATAAETTEIATIMPPIIRTTNISNTNTDRRRGATTDHRRDRARVHPLETETRATAPLDSCSTITTRETAAVGVAVGVAVGAGDVTHPPAAVHPALALALALARLNGIVVGARGSPRGSTRSRRRR